jgi:uncharacterized protein YjiS (DUF1127 family)
MSEKVIKIRSDVIGTDHWLRRLVANMKAWNVRRIAKTELRAMPDYLLKDIGVRRELVDAYVDGAVTKKSASVVLLEPAKQISMDDQAKAA